MTPRSAADEAYGLETQSHIMRVVEYLDLAVENLENRRDTHDNSKYNEPERSGFTAMNVDKRLSELTYGSDEYRAVLREHKPIIDHHYAANDHHPEHYPEGIRRMSAMALIEMLCDWKAATLRMKDGGDMLRSLEHNKDRFGIDDQLFSVLLATARELRLLE